MKKKIWKMMKIIIFLRIYKNTKKRSTIDLFFVYSYLFLYYVHYDYYVIDWQEELQISILQVDKRWGWRYNC